MVKICWILGPLVACAFSDVLQPASVCGCYALWFTIPHYSQMCIILALCTARACVCAVSCWVRVCLFFFSSLKSNQLWTHSTPPKLLSKFIHNFASYPTDSQSNTHTGTTQPLGKGNNYTTTTTTILGPLVACAFSDVLQPASVWGCYALWFTIPHYSQMCIILALCIARACVCVCCLLLG